jgi:DNA-binding NarL/FixJ family response regulator
VAAAALRCLLVGSQVLFLDGLRYLLEPEFEVSAVTTDMNAALSAAAAFLPQIAIIDLESGDAALEIGRRLCEAHPDLAVTYLTADVDRVWDVKVISKSDPTSELLPSIRRSRENLQPPASVAGDNAPALHLTARERQVLVLLLRGFSMKQVARDLGITPRTVAFHKYRIMETNGLRTNSELISFALCHGLLPNSTDD